jgi:CheY-like chemotaxis protein
MQLLIPHTGFLPTLVFDPDSENARVLAGQLAARGISVRVASSSTGALRAVKDEYFRVVVVVAELANKDCLLFLDSIHRAAPRSWLIVANTKVNRELTALVYRHGGDALVKAQVDPDDLAIRIASFQATSRPAY